MSGPTRDATERGRANEEAADIRQALPFIRRYARALTGGQAAGDALVARALREFPPAEETLAERGARAALYGAVGDALRGTAGAEAGQPAGQPLLGRMLLLLTALEDLPMPEAALACRVPAEQAERALRLAREGLRRGLSARVLIIEDEPVIALDIQELVERCGHSVIGIATTEAEAVAMAEAERPQLVLADIDLGAGGDGARAVDHILQGLTAPVVFVTAYPERLLTGQRPEPAFVIGKPFDPTALAVATYQAVTRGRRPV